MKTTATVGGYGYASIIAGGVQTYATTDRTHPTSFNGTLHVSAVSGQAQELQLEAEFRENYSFGGTGTASIDPYIYIDPTFANVGNYRILVSDGIGNTPAATAVPELASLALLGMGVAGIAAVRRRKTA